MSSTASHASAFGLRKIARGLTALFGTLPVYDLVQLYAVKLHRPFFRSQTVWTRAAVAGPAL